MIQPPLLHTGDTVEAAVRAIVESSLPALPVVDERERFVGIFGEHEFVGAVFPGYLKELKGAAFLRHSLDEALERREACRREPIRGYMNTEHVDVGPDHSDFQLAEIFLHHHVLVIPVVDDGRVVGLIRRSEFFSALAERFLGAR